MLYVNKNYSLQNLRELIQKEFQKTDYLQPMLNEEQKEILELFNKRIFLEECVEESVTFNKKLNWDNLNTSFKLATSVEELIEVYKLRSDVYTSINYQKEFPDTIEGLNFDVHDKTSAVIYSQSNSVPTGTTRLIFDSQNMLPSEEKFSFNYMREKCNTIGEISRLTIKHKSNGLSHDFKNLMKGLHHVFVNNEIDITLSGIKQEHFKLYSKFGGIAIEKELEAYGEVNVPCLIISWDPSQASKFFQRSFLK